MKAGSPRRPGYSWPWRAEVAVSFILLVLANFLVRGVSLSRWRWTLGAIREPNPAAPVAGRDPAAREFAAAVERAGLRLPSKCLPRAVALQWRLRLARIPSDLVIAFHLVDRQGEHGFHAWVEQAGEIVIGHCDREVYQPVLTLSQGAEPLAGSA